MPPFSAESARSDEPIRPLLLARHIEAAAEGAAGSQDPEHLPVSRFFIRERMKAIQRQNDVKRAVRKGQFPYIPLLKGHIFQVQAFCLLRVTGQQFLAL